MDDFSRCCHLNRAEKRKENPREISPPIDERAGPLIILDEIEKTGTSRRHGRVHDVMVGLFERETWSRWFDPYVEASSYFSHVSWLMTANVVESMLAVLLDRCRILPFPEPGADQVPLLASRILERLYVENDPSRGRWRWRPGWKRRVPRSLCYPSRWCR